MLQTERFLIELDISLYLKWRVAILNANLKVNVAHTGGRQGNCLTLQLNFTSFTLGRGEAQ